MAATGSGTLVYQWMKNEEPITDEVGFVEQFNTPSLRIQSFSPKHVGKYLCVVSSYMGTVHSNTAEIKGIFQYALK